MKRLLVILGVVGLLVVVAMGSTALAGKGPAPKVNLCHATDTFDIVANQWTLMVGHVITVSENAVPAHLAHHDSLQINDIDDGPVIFGLTWREVAENNGMNTTGATCAAFVGD